MSSDDLTKLRIDQARGFAALKVLLDERNSNIVDLKAEIQRQDVKIETLQKQVATLEAHHQNTKETTGRFALVHEDSLKAKGALEAHKDVEKTGLEKLKATAPIVVAVVTGVFGLISGVVALIATLLGHH